MDSECVIYQSVYIFNNNNQIKPGYQFEMGEHGSYWRKVHRRD